MIRPLKSLLVRAAFLTACASGGFAQKPAPAKLGIVSMQGAIAGTKDGQKAAQELQTRFAPRKKVIDGRNSEIVQMEEQIRKSGDSMSADKRNQMQRDIDEKKRRLQRDAQDAQEELNQAQQQLLGSLGQRVYAVVQKYAKDNGYTMVIDVSARNTPVLYAAAGTDITKEVVALYDKSSAAGTPSAPSGTGVPSAKP